MRNVDDLKVYLNGLASAYNHYSVDLYGVKYQLYLSNGDIVYLSFDEFFCAHLLGIQLKESRELFKKYSNTLNVSGDIDFMNSVEIIKAIINNKDTIISNACFSSKFKDDLSKCISAYGIKKLNSINSLNPNNLIDFSKCSVVSNPNDEQSDYHVVFKFNNKIISLGIMHKNGYDNGYYDCIVTNRLFNSNKDKDFKKLFEFCEVSFIDKWVKYVNNKKAVYAFVNNHEVSDVINSQKEIFGDVPVFLSTSGSYKRLVSYISDLEDNYGIRFYGIGKFFDSIIKGKKFELYPDSSVVSSFNICISNIDDLKSFNDILTGENSFLKSSNECLESDNKELLCKINEYDVTNKSLMKKCNDFNANNRSLIIHNCELKNKNNELVLSNNDLMSKNELLISENKSLSDQIELLKNRDVLNNIVVDIYSNFSISIDASVLKELFDELKVRDYNFIRDYYGIDCMNTISHDDMLVKYSISRDVLDKELLRVLNNIVECYRDSHPILEDNHDILEIIDETLESFNEGVLDVNDNEVVESLSGNVSDTKVSDILSEYILDKGFYKANYDYELRVRNRRNYLLACQLKNPDDKRKANNILSKYSVSKISRALCALTPVEREYLFKIYVGERVGKGYKKVDRDKLCEMYDTSIGYYSVKKNKILSFIDSTISNDIEVECDKDAFKNLIFNLSDSRKKWIMILKFGLWDSNRYSLADINSFLIANNFSKTDNKEINDIYEEILEIYYGKCI